MSSFLSVECSNNSELSAKKVWPTFIYWQKNHNLLQWCVRLPNSVAKWLNSICKAASVKLQIQIFFLCWSLENCWHDNP